MRNGSAFQLVRQWRTNYNNENKIEEGVEIGEKVLLCINRPIESADLRIEDFVGISFTHHMEILHKTTTLDERIYYIHQVNLHHWNKYVLRKYLSDDLYHHQGNMPNNFRKRYQTSSNQ